MAVLYTEHFAQFLDDNGNPLSGGKLYSYEAGTTTPKATFTTAAGSVENANPIILDSAGRATLFIEGSYRFDLFDSNDVLIDSTDNVTAFTTTGAEEDSFFESFSGDGETLVFTLSEAQGTDEKILLVATAFEYSVNGDFSTDSDWTKGTGWSIGSGVATATGAISTDLEQDAGRSLVDGKLYKLTYTITRSAGSITPEIGGTAGTARSSDGTYTENIIAGSTQKITFTTSGFTGTVDNVTVTEVDGISPISTSEFTINGTSLTFIDPPATGSNNVLVWNYSRLAGAASSSAAAAATSAANAATSAATASAVETRLTGIASTSSVAIGTGTKSFTVASGLGFTAGQFVLIDSDADGTNYMFGQVSSYDSTTLEVNVTTTGGSGTFADWTITVAGVQGVTGATGSVSATSAVVAATTAGAALQSSNLNNCISWGAGGAANSTLGGNMSGASTYKLVNMIDPTSAQDYATKNYVDTNSGGAWAVKESGTLSSATELTVTDISKTTMIFLDVTVSDDGTYISMQTSNDNGSTYDSGGANYRYALRWNEASGTTTPTGIGNSSSSLSPSPNTGVGNASDESNSSVWTIFDPANTAVNTLVNCTMREIQTDGVVNSVNFDGCRYAPEAVDAVRIFPRAGTTFSGTYVVLELN